jgi:hypothetical protein
MTILSVKRHKQCACTFQADFWSTSLFDEALTMLHALNANAHHDSEESMSYETMMICQSVLFLEFLMILHCFVFCIDASKPYSLYTVCTLGPDKNGFFPDPALRAGSVGFIRGYCTYCRL